MKSFNHINAETVNQAVKLLGKYRGKAKLIAGGMDLLGQLKDKVLPSYPEVLVNIKTIPGMEYIKEDAGILRIGPLAKLDDIAISLLVKTKYNILAQAALSVGSPQIRNMGTIGGNICQDIRCWFYRFPHQIGGRITCWRKGGTSCMAVSGDNRYHAIFGGKKCFAVCPSDIAVALTALDSIIKISGPGGDRVISIKEFFDPMGNNLKLDEIITEIQVPKPPDRARHTFLKYRLRESIDFAIVSIGSVFTANNGVYEEARLALGAVAPGVIRAFEAEQKIKGKAINSKTAEYIAEIAVKDTQPLSMNSYKVEITKALLKRSLLIEN